MYLYGCENQRYVYSFASCDRNLKAGARSRTNLKLGHQLLGHLRVAGRVGGRGGGLVRVAGPGGVPGSPKCRGLAPHVHHVCALNLHHCAHNPTQTENTIQI